MNVEEEENEEVTKDEGAHNMQIEEVLRGEDSSSSDNSYLVDFADFQFLQGKMASPRYPAATETIKAEKSKRK